MIVCCLFKKKSGRILYVKYILWGSTMLAHTCLHTVISDSPGVGFVYAVCKGKVKLPRWYSVQVIEGRCSRRRIVLRRNPWMTKPSVDKHILCMVSDR